MSVVRVNIPRCHWQLLQRLAEITHAEGLALGGWEDGLMLTGNQPFNRCVCVLVRACVRACVCVCARAHAGVHV